MSAWSIFWDKGTGRNYGFILQTFKANINLLSLLLFWRISTLQECLSSFLLQSNIFLVTNLVACFAHSSLSFGPIQCGPQTKLLFLAHQTRWKLFLTHFGSRTQLFYWPLCSVADMQCVTITNDFKWNMQCIFHLKSFVIVTPRQLMLSTFLRTVPSNVYEAWIL